MPGKHSAQNYNCLFMSVKALWLKATEKRRILGENAEVAHKSEE